MIASTMTLHAQERLQQRAIPPLVVGLLETFGTSIRSSGAEHLVFDKSALRRLRRHLGGERGLRMISPWLDVSAVIGDGGHLVTVTHRTRRFRRP
ncbi:MAG: hypothetical protein MIN69_12120 [Methylorubrum extorquens]|uniref:hypothetical protein n=1 Tax=Methylorubrum extorquens TaxID=408 RepID=UPI002FEE1D8A